MTVTDIVVMMVLLLMVGGAITYIVKAKKRGVKCVGCPYAESCAKKAGGNCSEEGTTEKK